MRVTMRNAHYWRAAGAASAPSNILVLDCETWHGADARVEGGEWQTLRLGCALAYRLEGGKRTRVKRLTFKTAEEFWALARSRLDSRRPLWIVGHNLPYDLGVVSGWGVITGPDYKTLKPCVSGQMFYIKGEWHGMGCHFVDTVNYYKCSLSDIGKAVGRPKLQFPDPGDSDRVWERYCENDVSVTADGLDHLIRFVRGERLGPWQPTIASLSFAALRARFLTEKVLVHVHPVALKMERASYYGGIVDTPHIGLVPACPVYELDVCSMFPAVARMDLPVRLVRVSDRVGPRRLRSLMEDFSCIAEVDIDSPDEPYPVRLKAGTYYPTGRFLTTLAHPELRHALDAGHVKYVRRVAWYKKVPIFREYMEYFVGRKEKYKAEGNVAFSTLCKYYANSLYGKTGQCSHTWREWGRESLQKVESDNGLTPGTLANEYDSPPDLYEFQATHRFPGVVAPYDVRNLYGVTEISVGESESRDSCPAVAATITSAARVLLRSFQRCAGGGHWFYSDTDSLWVDSEGFDRLADAGHIDPGALGFLDVKAVHYVMTVHGPKDYETDRVKRVKGLKATARKTADGRWVQLAFPGPSEQIKLAKPGGVMVSYVTKTLHRQITRSVVAPSGTARPLRFPEENPESKCGYSSRANSPARSAKRS